MLRKFLPKGFLRKFSTGVIVVGGGVLAYDGYANQFLYTGASVRFLRSCKVALAISKDYYLALHKGDKGDTEDFLKEVHLKSANRILEACLNNGGLYIKIGQGVSAINHILPMEYTKTLSKLHDKCLPSSKENIQKVFLKDFGDVPENIFEEFDYKPVAAASLAQVFKGKLKSGEQVAVKVQYNNLDKRFPSDVGTLIFLQNVIEVFFKNYNFGWILKDLRANLEKELDFCNEGANAERCWKDLSRFKNVYVPKIFWSYTKKRVLTMEWIDGFKITDIASLKKNNIDLKYLDKKLFHIFSEQIFNSGFVHADPHAGNLFIRSKKPGDFDLVILDHGLYEYLPEKFRKSLCQFWEAAVLRDENTMSHSAKELNIKYYKNFAEVLFQTPYENKGANIKTKLTDEDIKYMQEIAKNNFDKIMETLKEMPRNMLFVVRNLNTIRAISREHGDPIDRPRIMARYAQKCLWNRYSLFGFFKWVCRRAKFEFQIMKDNLKLAVHLLYLDTLHMLGRSTKNSKEILQIGEKYRQV
ncbi:uncharacterized aarF domain-containing protein kinase 5 [Condylostylus longicornis]|uniref:uncharacterized aarF domain-containing protein kinase 5 n=1 Tax=Condylostylus longicornis TaxID=2530218 RepID=UPI00244DECE8|nr:uncharacterized aarF domain-containing protein kinase 5 [Condylostylus longicornis]